MTDPIAALKRVVEKMSPGKCCSDYDSDGIDTFCNLAAAMIAVIEKALNHVEAAKTNNGGQVALAHRPLSAAIAALTAAIEAETK